MAFHSLLIFILIYSKPTCHGVSEKLNPWRSVRPHHKKSRKHKEQKKCGIGFAAGQKPFFHNIPPEKIRRGIADEEYYDIHNRRQCAEDSAESVKQGWDKQKPCKNPYQSCAPEVAEISAEKAPLKKCKDEHREEKNLHVFCCRFVYC